MPFQKPETYEKVWKRIQPFVTDHGHVQFRENRYQCDFCPSFWTSDPGKMCAHFQGHHKDAIAFGVLAE